MLRYSGKILALLLFPLIAHAAIYRWVDSHGGVHFSDRRRPGAVEINIPGQSNSSTSIPPQNTMATPANNNGQPTTAPTSPANFPAVAPTPSVKKEPINYTIAITDPTDQETIPPGYRDAMPVQVSVKPQLEKNQYVAILVNGKIIDSGAKTSFTLSNLDRGEHTLQARLIEIGDDKQETVLNTSEKITIYVRQTSILNR